MSEPDPLSVNVEKTIHQAEVHAVAKLIASGRPVYLGQVVDYTLEFPRPASALIARQGNSHQKPYRFTVEQWHLNAAEKVIQETRNK